MKLYIRWGSLARFDRLHKSSEFLQMALTKETSVRWSFKSEYKDEIEKLLKGIKYEMT